MEWCQQEGRRGVFYCCFLREKWFWQSSTDESTFVWIWESSEEFQSTVGEKISNNRCIEEGKRNSLTLPMSPLSQGVMAQCWETLSAHNFFHGESERHRWVPGFPRWTGSCLKGPFFSYLMQITMVTCKAEGLGEAGSMAVRTQNSSKEH